MAMNHNDGNVKKHYGSVHVTMYKIQKEKKKHVEWGDFDRTDRPVWKDIEGAEN